MRLKKFIKKNNIGSITNKEYFKNLTTLKVGGRIKYLVYPNSIDSLVQLIKYLSHKNIKYFIIGNGSNIVASDKVYKSVVINTKQLPQTLNIEDSIINVSAFYDLRRLVSTTVGKDISTFVELAGIPATVGGAIYMNAGAYNKQISTNLISVKVLVNNEIIEYNKEQLDFKYRYSIFHNNKAIILEAKFNIIKSNDCFIRYNTYLLKRKEDHPLLYPNCGSVFRNLEYMKAYEVIKELHLVGYTKGRAQISAKHCNFIINTSNAKGRDVYKIIKHVKKKSNYKLKEEVILLNFN